MSWSCSTTSARASSSSARAVSRPGSPGPGADEVDACPARRSSSARTSSAPAARRRRADLARRAPRGRCPRTLVAHPRRAVGRRRRTPAARAVAVAVDRVGADRRVAVGVAARGRARARRPARARPRSVTARRPRGPRRRRPAPAARARPGPAAGTRSVERAGRLGAAAEPLQPGGGEHDRVEVAVGEPAQPRVDVAAQLDDLEVVAQRQQLRARGAASSCRRARRRPARRARGAAQRVARVGPRRRPRRCRCPSAQLRRGRPWPSARRGRLAARAAPRSISRTQRSLSPRARSRSPDVVIVTISAPPQRVGDLAAPARARARCRACRASRAAARSGRTSACARVGLGGRARRASALLEPEQLAQRAAGAPWPPLAVDALQAHASARAAGAASPRARSPRSRARSRGDALSQRPAFSASTWSTIPAPCSRSAAIVGTTSSCAIQRAKRWISSSTTASALRALARADLEVARDDGLQVVDVVERDALDVAAGGVDVARDGDVDEHAAGGRARACMTSSSSSAPMIGCGEEVEATTMSALEQALGQLVERADRAAEALGQRAGAVGVAVGDEDRRDALVGQRLRRQLARLAGADDHDVARSARSPTTSCARARPRRSTTLSAARADRGLACARACRSAARR